MGVWCPHTAYTDTDMTMAVGAAALKKGKKKREFLSALVPIQPVEPLQEPKEVKCLDDTEDSFASEVLPWVLLGRARDAERADLLRQHRVTHIVNLAPESNVTKCEDITYLCIDVKDHSDQPILQHFDTVIQFLEETRRQNGKALVHCRQGVSRSATLVIAYLIKSFGLPLVLAKDVVKQRRPVINPNLGFVDALCNFQQQQNINLSMPLHSYKETLEEWSFASTLLDNERTGTSPDSTPLTSPPSPRGILCF